MAYQYYRDKGIRNASVHRPISIRVFRWLTVITIAGVLLSCAFVIAARQHFQAISTGYQTEELRKHASQLDERVRQLELEYSRAASPFEIEKKAAELGLTRPEGNPGKSPAVQPKAKERRARETRRP
jgi:hypothetical protein